MAPSLPAHVTREAAQALALLPRRSRRSFLLMVAANMLTATLDLVGIALVGLLGVFLVASVDGESAAAGPAASWFELLPAGMRDSTYGVVVLGAAAAGFLVAKSAIASYLSWWILRFLALQQTAVSERLTYRLFALPLQHIEVRTSQLTAYALTGGVTAAIIGLLGASAQALAELTLLVLLTAVLMYVNPAVTIVALTFFAGLALFMHLILGRWASANGTRASSSTSLLNQRIHETLGGYRDLYASGRLNRYIANWAPELERYARAVSTGMYISQVPKYVYESALLLGAVALAAWEFSAQPPAQAAATVAVFLAAGSRIMPSMLRLQNSLVAIRSSGGQADPTFALARQLEDSPSEPGPEDVPSAVSEMANDFAARIDLDGVVARYRQHGEPVLDGVTLHISAGSRVAIVGPTGAGKSTLVDVMLGILPIEKGSVTISNEAPREVIRRFAGGVAYVPQDVLIVEGTVRENVALGLDPLEVSDEDAWRCLEQVRLDSLFRGLPLGLATRVGERGVTLSGGQRQRMGLARALLLRPRLLFLDEATSALDAETEASITEGLRMLPEGTTMVVIAHRLATIRDSDVIVYLNDGRIKAQGLFEEVREKVPELDQAARLLGM